MSRHPSWRCILLVVLALGAWANAAHPDLVEERPCGPNALKGPIRYLFPQGFGRVNFRPACTQHDNCYENPAFTKEQCDAQFRAQMLSACEGSCCPILCRLRANVMYGLVRRFGAGAYAAGQAKGR